MRSFKMCIIFLALVILSFTYGNLSEARPEKELPSAVVVGSVYCDTCLEHDFSKATHFLSGALVAVECGDESWNPNFREEVKTNEDGEFKVELPNFSVTKHVEKIKGCSVKLIKSPEPYCDVASSATSSSLHLKSRNQGTHIFSAGYLTFKPLKQPRLCSQKPSAFNSKKTSVSSPQDLIFPPPIQNPEVPFIPPVPILPALPPLPNFPTHPPVLHPKIEKLSRRLLGQQETSVGNSKFPVPLIPLPLPVPLPLPHPSILPNPTIIPPINLPPLIPGGIPSLPPPPVLQPPPPVLQPPPDFPGVPPFSSSLQKSSP